ncbi:hypothetical protein SCALM49S_09071 [Streptomyces californicus]
MSLPFGVWFPLGVSFPFGVDATSPWCVKSAPFELVAKDGAVAVGTSVGAVPSFASPSPQRPAVREVVHDDEYRLSVSDPESVSVRLSASFFGEAEPSRTVGPDSVLGRGVGADGAGASEEKDGGRGGGVAAGPCTRLCTDCKPWATPRPMMLPAAPAAAVQPLTVNWWSGPKIRLYMPSVTTAWAVSPAISPTKLPMWKPMFPPTVRTNEPGRSWESAARRPRPSPSRTA